MNDRRKQLIVMCAVYAAAGLIALILAGTGFNVSAMKKEQTVAKQEEPAVTEEPAAEPEPEATEPEAAAKEPAPAQTSEEPAAEEPEKAEEPEEPETIEEPAKPEETPALGPEGKPLTVLAETAEEYKSFKTLNREKILHVRVAPDINSEIVARLSPGTEGLVLEVGEHWSRIRSFDGTITGYCSNEYLTFTDITKEEFQKLKKDYK